MNMNILIKVDLQNQFQRLANTYDLANTNSSGILCVILPVQIAGMIRQPRHLHFMRRKLHVLTCDFLHALWLHFKLDWQNKYSFRKGTDFCEIGWNNLCSVTGISVVIHFAAKMLSIILSISQVSLCQNGPLQWLILYLCSFFQPLELKD